MKNPGHLPKLLARWVVVTISISLLLFAAAGTTRLPSLLNYLATFSAFQLATMLAIDPGLAKERSSTFEKKGTSGRFATSLSFLATLTIAAFDVGRIHWPHSVPLDARRISLVLFAAAMAFQMWAMIVNPFFSPEIRLQTEREHELIADGPYHLLRHPGYLAMLVAVPASALAIGSWLALVPAAAFCLTILKRAGAEEAFLQQKLTGYSEYMHTVRGRLFPRLNFRRHATEIQFLTISRLKAQTRGDREDPRAFDSC